MVGASDADNGKEDAVVCEITRKRTLGKGGGGG